MRILNVILVSLLLGALLLSLPRHHARVGSTGACTMTTLDVGQGDAIVFETSDHHTVLFDGGVGDIVLDALDRSLPVGTTTLDLVVATHPDADHIGGLIPVLERYDVQSILTTGAEVTTKLFAAWQKAIDNEHATILHAQAGKTFTVGTDFIFEEVWPQKDYTGVRITESSSNGAGGTNDTSIVGRVTCGGSTALMTGDASYAVEEQLVHRPEVLRASVLKAGHHGSRYATTLEFLRAVQPEVTVFSVGKKNRYGHPHPTVLDRLDRLGIPYLRTDEVGDIELISSNNGAWQQK